MKKEKRLYAITDKDVINVSDEVRIPVSSTDLFFIGNKVGDFFGSQWHDAVEYALTELKRAKESKLLKMKK